MYSGWNKVPVSIYLNDGVLLFGVIVDQPDPRIIKIQQPVEITLSTTTVKYSKPFVFTDETTVPLAISSIQTIAELSANWKEHYSSFISKLYSESELIESDEDDSFEFEEGPSGPVH